MKMNSNFLKFILLSALWISQVGFSSGSARTGFLIIAPDRGFIGNQEIMELMVPFKENYIASMALIGKSYNGMGGEYSNYIQKAIGELNEQNVSEVVVIPLFFSNSNTLLRKIKKHLPSYQLDQIVTWASPLGKSYLTAQILLDRVNSISKNSKEERLVVIGLGAMDKASEKGIKKEIKSLTDYVQNRKSFQEVQIGVYYNRDADPKLRNEKREEVDELVVHTAAKKGKTLLVPFFLGPKFSHEMSLTYWLGRKFKDLDITFQREEILPHPNILIWMKKTANRYLDVDRKKVGVVVMPHGATQPYNDAVEATIKPLRKKYSLEIAYGMADGRSIELAIQKLENRGVRNIVFVRMYSLIRQFKGQTDYILGLSDKFPEDTDREIPSQVRASATISSFGGYEESPLTAEILWDRIKEISTDPSRETVILLAHGSKKDEDNQAWRNALRKHIDWIQSKQKTPYKAIHGLTLREDWRVEREESLSEIKKVIQIGNKNGRVLLISDRLYGSGPYKHFLKGLKFELNGTGLATHPNLTKWLENGIEDSIKNGFFGWDEKAKIAVNPTFRPETLN